LPHTGAVGGPSEVSGAAHPTSGGSSPPCSLLSIPLSTSRRLDERPQNLPKSLQRLACAALDGPQGLAQLVRDFGLRQPPVVGELDCASLSLRQLTQGIEDSATRDHGVDRIAREGCGNFGER